MQEERDRLNSTILLQQQITLNSKEKQTEVGEIYKEEIAELKENLERKEYLLQLSEQRSAAFEKLLLKMSQHSPEVAREIAQQNIVLKDRKISNVTAENLELRDKNHFLAE